MLGERMATGLNASVIYDSGQPVNPDGYLITSSGAYFITSGGDRIVYAQIP